MKQLMEFITPASRRGFILGYAAALAVLTATIIAGLAYVRSAVRAQIAGRDAEALYATTVMEQFDVAAAYGDALEPDQLAFEAALLASRLKGVIGIRFFDEHGKFKDSFPANIQARDLQAWAVNGLKLQRPNARYAPGVPLDQVFIYLPQFSTGHVARADFLEVIVPLDGSTRRNAAAEFILEGASIAVEYGRLDRQLARIGITALVLSGALLGGMLWPVFQKAQRLNADLKAHNEMLQRANQELALAARTSALGAVSAHLMHGLKNPLASLSAYLRDRTDGHNAQEWCEGADALKAAHRMQSMVEETLEVLADARGEPGYSLSVSELIESVCNKAQAQGAHRRVQVLGRISSEAQLPSRVANLVRLILSNLVDNAIQATPAGRTVSVLASQQGQLAVRIQVKDEGPGLPPHLLGKVFLPCTSTKGGSGIGLAISHRLAEHLGARLKLERSSPEGCVFELELPLGEECVSGAIAQAGRSAVGRLHPI